MPQKKRLKADANQKTLANFLTTRVSEDTKTCSSETESKTEQSKRKFQPKWLKIWPWLTEKDGKIFCKICTCIEKGKTNAFTTGCSVMKTSSLCQHEINDDHKSALLSDTLKVDFEQAMKTVYNEEVGSVIKAIRVLMWLAGENLPLSKYKSLMGLLKTLGVNIAILSVFERVNYDSYYTANELLEAVSTVCDPDVNAKIAQSPYISVLADESTDRANKKRMTLNPPIINRNTSVSEAVFLRNIEYNDGTGVDLSSVIIQELENRTIPINKLIGFGSDGASVTTENDKGVKGLLLKKQPHLIHVHCMAHHLALCTSQAADKVQQIRDYQHWLTTLFYYFDASGTRGEKELHTVQDILDLQTYRDGSQQFPTLIEQFEEHATLNQEMKYEFLNHVLRNKGSNLTLSKSRLMNQPLSNIRQKFPQKTLMDAFFVLGMRSISCKPDPTAYGNEEIDKLLDHYGVEKCHMGSVSPPVLLKEAVRKKWRDASVIVRSLKYPVDRFVKLWQLLTEHHKDEIPNIIKLAQIALMLPLHTADCERTFSQQNQIITKSRSKLSADHLDQLLRSRLAICSGVNININKVLYVWKNKRKRKIYTTKRTSD